jgi:hypothetical protein
MPSRHLIFCSATLGVSSLFYLSSFSALDGVRAFFTFTTEWPLIWCRPALLFKCEFAFINLEGPAPPFWRTKRVCVCARKVGIFNKFLFLPFFFWSLTALLCTYLINRRIFGEIKERRRVSGIAFNAWNFKRQNFNLTLFICSVFAYLS